MARFLTERGWKTSGSPPHRPVLAYQRRNQIKVDRNLNLVPPPDLRPGSGRFAPGLGARGTFFGCPLPRNLFKVRVAGWRNLLKVCQGGSAREPLKGSCQERGTKLRFPRPWSRARSARTVGPAREPLKGSCQEGNQIKVPRPWSRARSARTVGPAREPLKGSPRVSGSQGVVPKSGR